MKVPSRIRSVELKNRKLARDDDEKAFLKLHRLKIQNVYLDGSSSAEYDYDGVTRKWFDAVVMGLLADLNGQLSVCLRACIRPPLLLRTDTDLFDGDETPPGVMWELPAGLLEEGEGNAEGIKKRAAIEAMEETGYSLTDDDFTVLEGAPFLSPGVLPERIHFVYARVADLGDKCTPQGDGSPAEDDEGIWWVPVSEALEMCKRGEIKDAKTELGLHRIIASGFQ